MSLRRSVFKFLVHALTLVHLGLIFIILFGWLLPQLWWLYGFSLIATALSWLVFDRCILVDVEYWLRKQGGMSLDHKESLFTATFLGHLFGREVLSEKMIRVLGVSILSVSIVWWLYLYVYVV